MNNKYSKNFYFILTISIVLFALVNVFVSYPLIKDIINKNHEISAKNTELASINTEREIDTKLFQKKDEIQTLYDKIFAYLPENINESDFIVQLTEIAKISNQNQTGVTISHDVKTASQSATNKESTKTESKLTKIGFSVTEESFFIDLVNFMNNLEKMNRMFTIESLSIKTKIDNILETSINGTIYSKDSAPRTVKISDITPKETEIINNLKHFGSEITADVNPESRTDPFSATQ